MEVVNLLSNQPSLFATYDQFLSDCKLGALPDYSFVEPNYTDHQGDGGGESLASDQHPDHDVQEGEVFIASIYNAIHQNPDLWKTTVVFITVDEGGGYYDSGYIQQLDYFGDGTRIPLLTVSPFTTGGHINHSYTDHVSILKFIEKNWGLSTISNRSRDNLPNPQQASGSYIPTNSPALGDLMDMFDFSSAQ